MTPQRQGSQRRNLVMTLPRPFTKISIGSEFSLGAPGFDLDRREDDIGRPILLFSSEWL
jgi:hypothetical protein